MNKNDNSIYEFDINMICDFFSNLERQGPGSPETTVKALGFIDNLTAQSQIADLGCGTGGQTMTLAAHTQGSITAIDLFPGFVDRLNAKAAALRLDSRVKGVIASMDDLPFAPQSIDLIWSEGAIYNIGFERGLRLWHGFLKENGHIAVSDASWFTDNRPEEIERFWADAYPEMDTIQHKMAQIQRAGYAPVAAFAIPERCWTDLYYTPQKPVQERFLIKYAGNRAAERFIAFQRHEAELYRRYKQYYGYVFYIARKRTLRETV